MKTILLLVLCAALSGCEMAGGLYDKYPGGTYSYRTKDGRMITVIVSDKAPATTAK